MRINSTEEMRKLEEIFKPYVIGCHLVSDAPKEVIEAKKKHMDLFIKEREKALNLL